MGSVIKRKKDKLLSLRMKVAADLYTIVNKLCNKKIAKVKKAKR